MVWAAPVSTVRMNRLASLEEFDLSGTDEVHLSPPELSPLESSPPE